MKTVIKNVMNINELFKWFEYDTRSGSLSDGCSPDYSIDSRRAFRRIWPRATRLQSLIGDNCLILAAVLVIKENTEYLDLFIIVDNTKFQQG